MSNEPRMYPELDEIIRLYEAGLLTFTEARGILGRNYDIEAFLATRALTCRDGRLVEREGALP